MRFVERFPTRASRWFAAVAAVEIGLVGVVTAVTLLPGGSGLVYSLTSGTPSRAVNLLLFGVLGTGGALLWLLPGERARRAGDRAWFVLAMIVFAAIALSFVLSWTYLTLTEPIYPRTALAARVQALGDWGTYVGAVAVSVAIVLALRAARATVTPSLAGGLFAYPVLVVALDRGAFNGVLSAADDPATFLSYQILVRSLVGVMPLALALHAHTAIGSPNPRLARATQLLGVSLVAFAGVRAFWSIQTAVMPGDLTWGWWTGIRIADVVGDASFLVAALALALAPPSIYADRS